MRDEALIHFHLGGQISCGVHLGSQGMETPVLLGEAAAYFDRDHPGRCVAGFCAVHAHLVEDIVGPPPPGWESWRFMQWDSWFGRINGTFLFNLGSLEVVQYPMYQCAPRRVRIDLSQLPGRLVSVA